MAVVKAFFFDLDGTLVDTHGANVAAYSDAILQITNHQPVGELEKFIRSGENSNDFLPKSIVDASDEIVGAINQRKKEVYPTHLGQSVLNEYLSTFLKQMSVHAVTVLVTTAKKDNALAVLKHHGLNESFTHMIFGDDVQRMKPAPEAYELALTLAGVQKEEVIAFEDSEKGIEAATAAGLSVVHIRAFEL